MSRSRSVRLGKFWAVAVVCAVVSFSCVAGCSGGEGLSKWESFSKCHPGVNAAEFWIINGPQLQDLNNGEAQAVRYAFKQQNIFILEKPGKVSQVGRTVADFPSYSDFKQAVEDRAISPNIHWVMYDDERWAQTPTVEQSNPIPYMTLFAGLAHLHGYKVILSPAQDLVFANKSSDSPATGPAWQRYLSMGLAAAAARVADIYEIQAQSDELPNYRNSNTYKAFISSAVYQAQDVNPQITIFAGMSTQRVSDAAQLYVDFIATRSLVSGYWLNIPNARGEEPQGMAAGFLQRLPPAAAAVGASC